MPTPILSTKLFLPRPRSQNVARPHLLARLNAGLERTLTLLSAPAGFGKTTLLSEWLAVPGAKDVRVAWLSLDAGENDPARFLAYLVAALQTAEPTLGTGVAALLDSPQPPPPETILTTLLNEIHSLPARVILVLDDYHVLDSPAVDAALVFLLEHIPHQLHLVLATREDPQLPLARLRARGQLAELRAVDLRFSLDEAAAFLREAMGLNLAAADVAALEARTEGWIAGLQLAALSLQGHHDAAGFVRSFSGSHHFVLDYLLEEVLNHQPPQVESFLLRTSILDRMCGPLCDAVLGDGGWGGGHGASLPTPNSQLPSPTPQSSSQRLLDQLERANLFLVPLDAERRWYRYHHLFADLLRQRLLQQFGSAAELHLRASAWFEAQGFAIEAFRHAAAANDIARAERLMAGPGMPLHSGAVVSAMLGWLAALPPTVLNARPALWVKHAEILLVAGQTTGVEQNLQAAEAALRDLPPGEETRHLIGHIANARATVALTQYNVEGMLTQARRALEYLDPEDRSFRATANWSLSFAHQMLGDRVAAGVAIREAVALSEAAGDPFTLILSTIGLGQLEEGDNDLHAAAASYRRVLELAGDQPQQIIYEPHIGLARILLEWNDLAAAEQHARQGIALARQYEQVIDRFIVCELVLARVLLAQGDTEGVAALLAQLEQAAHERGYTHRLPDIAAAQVPVLLRQGKLADARHLAQTFQLPAAQARVLLAEGEPLAAAALLKPLRTKAATRGWRDETLRLAVLEAAACHSCGDAAQALEALGVALALAEPGGSVRVFLDEGLPMKQLLHGPAARALAPEYTRRLLAAFAPPAKRAAPPAAIDALSERELEVLRHIAEGRTDREIAERLFLSLYTVKVHARNIYGKLGVNKRTQAVARARELGMLPRG